MAFLKECRRILKPGGVLRIAVPDLDKFIDCHLEGGFDALAGYPWTDLNYLMGGPPSHESRDHWRHKYMYSACSLAISLWLAGFTSAHARGYDEALDTPEYRFISLYMEAS
jgi:SAM-dependent methyltransferase